MSAEPVLNDVTLHADGAAAVEFMRRWAGSGYWVITSITTDRDINTKTFGSYNAELVPIWVRGEEGKNLYYSVNQPGRVLRKKAKKAEIANIVGLHVDADLKGGRDAEEEAALLETMRAIRPPLTVIIFSGGGYQGLWKFSEQLPATKENVAKVEEANKALARFFKAEDLKGDSCHNIDRIMRLAGTINHPDAKKRAKGRVPTPVEVVETDWSRTYDADDLITAIVETAPPPAKKNAASGGATDVTPREVKSFEDLPQWLRDAITTGETENSGDDRSRAVFSVVCELVRSGWADDAIAAILVDRRNGISAHIRAQAKPKRYAQRQIDRARDATADDYCRSNHKIVANHQGNIRRALANLRVTVSHDTFADRLLIEGPDGEPRRFLDDAEMAELWLSIDRQCGFRPTKDFFFDVVIDTARGNAFHPVRDYLDSLRWDGVPRLDQWLVTYAGAEDGEYVRAVGRLVLIAAVRRAREPGCKFDEMMVLESAQGTEKSSALEALAVDPDWFSDSLPLNADDKKVIETLAGRWIVEAAELKGLRKGDIEHLKAFLSRRIDRARMSYGRLVTEVPRQCVIVGTTNSDRYLRDSTGNRRFWPVRVERFDLAELRHDRDQLWAEAVQAEARGESIRLDPSLYVAAGEVQEERRIEDPWVGMIEGALRDDEGNDINGILTVDCAWIIVNVPEGMRTQEHNARLGEAMKELEWERIRPRIGGSKRYAYARGTEAERELWISVSRDPETRQLYVEAMDKIRRREVEEAAAEEKRQSEIPF